ncbi:hypothetical protein [Streptomyces sp. NPDC002164]|uniref:hypothetical protein n=1 Tax=Streptomyces sp. NPDC002164 TaxID=3364633 RepID=UPI00369E676F
MGFAGPALVAADTAHRGIEYEAGWDDVATYVGQVLPFGAVTEIPVQHATVSGRWPHRLTMGDPTAVLAQDAKVEAFFIDPLTDMPVLRTPGDGGKQVWRFYAPLSLPVGGAGLASVVLHHTLWVLTSDGHVHPAPCTPTEHLWWGDGWATGPAKPQPSSTSSRTASAPPSTCAKYGQAPKGLTALFNEEHKKGAEVTRATLLHARMTPPRNR